MEILLAVIVILAFFSLRSINELKRNINRHFGQLSKSQKKSNAQIDIFVPSWPDRGSPHIAYTVGTVGLVRSMEFVVYAELWMHGEKSGGNHWMVGQQLKIVSTESTLNGFEGSLSYLRIHDKQMLGYSSISCSPSSFDLIFDSIKNGKSIVIRMNGRLKPESLLSKDVEKMQSDQFEVFIGDASSGASYFCGRLDKHLATMGADKKEKFYLGLYEYYVAHRSESETPR